VKVIRRLALLTAGVSIFWLLLALPSRHVWGEGVVVCSAIAALVCLIPACLTLAWASWSLQQTPDQQLVTVLGGTGLRMFSVVAVAWLLYKLIPYLQEQPGYWVWILVFYLFTLALEMVLVLTSIPADKSR
jgi:hypothetical protein